MGFHDLDGMGEVARDDDQVGIAKVKHPGGIEGRRVPGAPARDQVVADEEVEVRVGDVLRVARAEATVESNRGVVAERGDRVLGPVEVHDDLAGHLRRQCFQTINRRVFTHDVVPQLGPVHCFAHRRTGQGYRVAA